MSAIVLWEDLMSGFTVINYQGSKNNLDSFIYNSIEKYIPSGKTILDIFCGAGSVSNIFRTTHKVFANDVENYSYMIVDAILNQPDYTSEPNFFDLFSKMFEKNTKQLSSPVLDYIKKEQEYVSSGNTTKLIHLYKEYPTVWNGKKSPITSEKLTVEVLRRSNKHNLFTSYYGGSYFGIEQAVEIDSLIKCIQLQSELFRNSLYACLFYAMKEAVFSKDGHMAQPLNPEKNERKLLSVRKKSVFDYFKAKFNEYLSLPLSKYNGKNSVFNFDFNQLIEKADLSDVGLIYADPPYTDMQYSRYYHLLSVAANYDYPDLTVGKNGKHTTGLYTEGRFQSKLSQRSSAAEQIKKLMLFCKNNNINLALSYAYPQDPKKQHTARYTVSIDTLIEFANDIFEKQVSVVKQKYSHSNHRNSEQKRVNEYLIICGKKRYEHIGIDELKSKLEAIQPSKRNPMYDSHLYWSQKPFNVCDTLIELLTEENDIVFDPFLGSGVTTLEAIKADYNRKAVGCDINDMPMFISNTLLSLNNHSFDINILNSFSERIQKFNDYYSTKCPICGDNATITKVIFDKPDRQGNTYSIKSINYTCSCGSKGSKAADKDDLNNMTNTYRLSNISNTSLIPNSKIAVTENDDIKNIFTGRNLHVLDSILSIVKEYDEHYQTVFEYILMSVLHLCKITDKHSNSQWPLWIPKVDCVEKNVIDVYTKKIKKFAYVVTYMQENYPNSGVVQSFSELAGSKCLLLKKGCQYITELDIPNDSIDLIITDPPYMEQVLYSEYMQLYKPFINLDYNLDDEIVVSSAPSREKNKDNYFELLDQAFKMCSDKLKQGHYLCLYFHDSNLNVWDRLVSTLENNKFRFISQAHIDKTVTLKNIISPKKSLNGDSILFFLNDSAPIIHSADESIEEMEQNIIRQAKYMVKTNGALSTPELYDNGLMEVLIQNGWLHAFSEKYSSLVDIFEKHLHWNQTISKWEL